METPVRKFSGFLRRVLLLASVMLAATAGAQGSNSAGITATSPTPNAYDLKENYTKYEYQIPMRDGKRLFTSVYLPKGRSDDCWSNQTNAVCFDLGDR
jgi:hypothetical protein